MYAYALHVQTSMHIETIYNRELMIPSDFFYMSFVKPLQQPRYPAGSVEANRAGSFLADGFKAVLWALTGDLDYFHAMLGTPNYSAAGGPCMHCRCTLTGPNTWTDFRDEALWRTSRWQGETWRAWEGRTQCVLLTLPGASCWTIAYD